VDIHDTGKRFRRSDRILAQPDRVLKAHTMWHDILLKVLKANQIRLVAYVPDRVLTPLISALAADDFFTVVSPSREEEAVGIVAGAWMGGTRGVVLMQTSGFATLPNVLASLAVPYQIPVLMVVSERGTLGEFNIGQAMVCRTMRPVLECLGIENHTIARDDELQFIADKTIQQAFLTLAPACLILSPLLTSPRTKGETR
jgi:sulfopyruvate decarboxylase alpha subunit